MKPLRLFLAAWLLTAPHASVAQVEADFSAGGGVKIGESTTACDSTVAGALRYDSTDKCMEFCDSSAWKQIACGCTNPASGLVGHWMFNESGNVSTADDSAGTNDGALTNFPADPSANWVAGKLGNALNFDGSNDRVEMADNSVFTSINDFTVAAWVYPASISGYDPVVTFGDQEGDEFGFNLHNGKANFFAYDVTPNEKEATTAVTVNAWSHVIVVREGSEYRFYLNGAGDGSSTGGSQTITPANYRALGSDGGAASAGSERFHGRLDDVRIYNRALDATEIAALYNGGAGCQ